MSDGHTQRLESALDGRYKIERKLGEGGMASVYLAEDIKHKRKVALKILRPELAAVIGAERFLSEITTTANLSWRCSIRGRLTGTCTTSCRTSKARRLRYATVRVRPSLDR